MTQILSNEQWVVSSERWRGRDVCVQRPRFLLTQISPIPPKGLDTRTLETGFWAVSYELWVMSTQMVILNSFQDLSAEKDKIRLAVRCWTKFSMTYGGICYFYTHFGKANSILMSKKFTALQKKLYLWRAAEGTTVDFVFLLLTKHKMPVIFYTCFVRRFGNPQASLVFRSLNRTFAYHDTI